LEDISRDILIRASRGDMEAFEIIYRATSDFVYRTALRITNNRDDAEDVTQDVFIKVYQNLKDFQFRSSFKTWVYRIAVNTAITTCKGISKEMDRIHDDDSSLMDRDMDQYASSQMPEAPIDKEDNEKLVASLLETLNPDQRACIVLREIEGLNYQEISEVLKININTVRSRLKRARETLLAYKNSEVITNGV
jgi:RNA polymerase sigma-70 factor, ECF subfamily